MGIPVRSHEIVPGRSGKGISKGGPFITSDAAARAPSILANASFLVSSLCKDSSPIENEVWYKQNNIYIFCKIR